MRANIERECARIARGEASFETVVAQALGMFKRRFEHFVKHAHRLPSMVRPYPNPNPHQGEAG